MKRLVQILSLSTILLSSVAISNAADAVYVPEAIAAPAAAVAYDWTGFYAGVGVGWVGVRPNSAAANLIQDNSDGVTGGVFAGYNYQMGSFVLGAEADFYLNGASSTVPCFNPAFQCNSGSDWNGSLRVRAGVAADRVHVYATGGFAIADYNGFTDNGVRFADRKTLSGWTAGGGIEFAATNRLIVGVEALYSDYGNTTMAYDIPYAVSPNFTSVRLKAALKF